MDARASEQTKTVFLTPLGNKQKNLNGAKVNQHITFVGRSTDGKITVLRTLGKTGSCVVQGDPHVTTFDLHRGSYLVNAAGFNQIVKSEFLNIQARFFLCSGNGITCMDALIISYKGDFTAFSTHANKVRRILFSKAGATIADKTIAEGDCRAHVKVCGGVKETFDPIEYTPPNQEEPIVEYKGRFPSIY
jgi:hypothetical protein